MKSFDSYTVRVGNYRARDLLFLLLWQRTERAATQGVQQPVRQVTGPLWRALVREFE